MDYKEKYEQALERARQFSEKPYLEDSAGIVEYIFPELAESEDERIKKEITELVMLPTWKTETEFYRRKELVAWLEKQAEQKPADKKELSQSKVTKISDQEWSEEDEKHLSWLIKYLNQSGELYSNLIDWLKSIKDRYTWKPSDEQIEYLAKAILTLGNEGDCKTAAILNELRIDLKKLKDESYENAREDLSLRL